MPNRSTGFGGRWRTEVASDSDGEQHVERTRWIADPDDWTVVTGESVEGSDRFESGPATEGPSGATPSGSDGPAIRVPSSRPDPEYYAAVGGEGSPSKGNFDGTHYRCDKLSEQQLI